MLPILPLILYAGWGDLPEGAAPEPVPVPHFPDRMHAFIWRNWALVPLERLAEVLGTQPDRVRSIGVAMGLPDRPPINEQKRRRCHITLIRRNWHLLPYDQLLQLLGWREEELAYTLREDDFLWHKLGSLKPRCGPLRYVEPSEETRRREAEIRAAVQRYFPEGLGEQPEPLFAFIDDLTARSPRAAPPTKGRSRFSPRFCYSYFALYGDPLATPELDPYPDGYLQKLAAVGVNGVWMQAVLYKLSPFPWAPELSEGWEERLRNLSVLAQRARRHGIGIYLYLNEPRAMPLSFYQEHLELKGVVEGDHAALCTSVPEVQDYIVDALRRVFAAVPQLAGAFSITASENLTNCHSHRNAAGCPRCSERPAADVIAEVNSLFARGVREGNPDAEVIVWDWGWSDDRAAPIIERLPDGVALMSVSEWSLPISRGGVESAVGEYSISSVGPGPRATRHWGLARKHGLRTIAKVQASNTWELSAVPYVPAVELVAQHIANLSEADVDGIMLGWTLGGYPSPNMEVAAELGAMRKPSPTEAMRRVARRRFGRRSARDVVAAWSTFSQAFREFPFHIALVYRAPMQYGPSNLLWKQPTGYRATMIGFPYDDLDGWRAIYPPEVFIRQFEAICQGWKPGVARLGEALASVPAKRRSALERELNVARAAHLHFRTVANQARFVVARDALAVATGEEEAGPQRRELERLLRDEIAIARELYVIQARDSRIGYEASNHYYYVPLDLVEKIVNCDYLLRRWLGVEA
ncbi:MAG: hypothetical protein ACE5R4_06175 [Armatimonadota bacterium]